jgi:hypothetical protein
MRGNLAFLTAAVTDPSSALRARRKEESGFRRIEYVPVPTAKGPPCETVDSDGIGRLEQSRRITERTILPDR